MAGIRESLAMLFACAEGAPDIGSGDPRRAAEQAVAGFEVAEGLAVTLFAAEPMTTNPANIDVDARGRVWICEAVNYRPDYNPHHAVQEAGERIVILEDTTGDGRADVRKVFYQGTDVNAALGIAVAGDQVIVSSSPNVLVFTDTNGDDVPDRKEVLFSGIGGLQDDHGVHAFVFGPDGRWYFNFGNAGAQLMDNTGEPVRDLEGRVIEAAGTPFRQGMALRLARESDMVVEVLGHNFRNPYELTIDAFGTVWQSDNDDDGNQGVRFYAGVRIFSVPGNHMARRLLEMHLPGARVPTSPPAQHGSGPAVWYRHAGGRRVQRIRGTVRRRVDADILQCTRRRAPAVGMIQTFGVRMDIHRTWMRFACQRVCSSTTFPQINSQ